MKRNFVLLFLIGLLSFPATILAQEPEPEDIALDSDEFQNYFYESIKQKGMENYDRAIESLEKCLAIQPNNPAILFELGKNYYNQKKYKDAYDNFEKVTKIDDKNRWAYVGMYDVCYDTKDFNQAIIVVQKLIPFKEEYKEDLVSLYMNTQQFDKALVLINELNDRFGKTEKRELYKADILKDAKYQGSEKNNLIDLIKNNPKEESNYIQLISLYSKSNQEEKAEEIARQLEKEIPNSDWAQVSLFKFNINNNDGAKAVESMNKVFKSEKIDKKIKHRILNEFLIFTQKNPQYSSDLEKAISYFADDKEVKVASEIGKFFYNKKDWTNAANYFQMHLKSNPNDVENALLLLECYVNSTQFDKVVKTANNWLELFPSQPQFYYYSGLGYNQLSEFKKAKDVLESGLDFLVDDKALEINFNIQLGEAYNGLGDAKKKEMYFTKANDLLKNQKK
jgi:tetratricopeptide (TPR) repeat protein